MDRYQNRQDAGKTLAQALQAYAGLTNLKIFALPRGGIPVGFEIAKALHAPLEALVVRKLGVPGQDELAMGAIGSNDVYVLNEETIRSLRISPAAIKRVKAHETKELERRNLCYSANPPSSLEDSTVILVDDGIATGATIRAAIKVLRQAKAQKIILAVAVADKFMCEKMAELVDEVICPLQPLYLIAVGAHYEEFAQVSDQEVINLLNSLNQSAI